MSRPRAQAGAAKLVAILAATALLHLGVVATIRPESLPRHAAPSSSPEPAAEPAEVLRRASIEIAAAEATHGPESREVATLLGATAQSLWWLEAYPAALPLSERALAISERTDPGSAVLAGLLYQVGELCRALGDYAGALRRLDEARALWSRTLGPRSPEVAAALHYLGVVHATTGDRDGARRLFEEALAIRLEKGGEDQEPVAATLVALAGLAADAGDPVAADRLQARALGIWERLHGPDHPMVARGLSGWAARRVAAGDLAGARALLERALAIRIGALGPDHDLVARTEIDLAEVRAREGEGLEAERLYHAALDRSRRRLDPDHPQVTEALLGLARLRWARGDRDGATAAAIDAETLARRRFLRTARGLSDGEALQYETMRATGLGLALTALADRSVCEGGAAILRRIDAEVIAARAIVLDNLTRRSAVAAPAVEGAIPAGEGPDEAAAVSFFDQVRRALPTGATLLAYVRYRQVDARGLDAGAAYLAFVLRSGAVAPEVVPLGDAEPIDAAVAAWREEVSVDPRLAEGPRPGRGDAGLDRAARAVGDALRQAVWDPIAERLGGAALLLVVTDGALQQISLATLPDRGDRFVIDTTPPIHYLGAERDLVRLRAPAPRGRGALFVGGVDFDAPARAATDRGPSEARPPAPERFDPLPGTRAEVETLRTLRPDAESPELLTGAAATTAAFRALAPGRRLLHLATHAWFMGTAGAPSILADRRLLSSGVAFAGANRPGGDGILIADQIAALDLSAAEWVVLSACDTGSGHLLGSEGVIGLRRAFERAGARTVVTSLWPADDGAARLWMRALYDARAAGRSTPDAVRDASLQILEQARRSGRTPHPYYWGAFVAAGDWR